MAHLVPAAHRAGRLPGLGHFHAGADGHRQPGDVRVRQELPDEAVPRGGVLPGAGDGRGRHHPPRVRDHLPALLTGRALLHEPALAEDVQRAGRTAHASRQEEKEVAFLFSNVTLCTSLRRLISASTCITCYLEAES